MLSSSHFRAQAAASTGYGQQREVKALVDLKESFPVNLARFCGGFQLPVEGLQFCHWDIAGLGGDGGQSAVDWGAAADVAVCAAADVAVFAAAAGPGAFCARLPDALAPISNVKSNVEGNVKIGFLKCIVMEGRVAMPVQVKLCGMGRKACYFQFQVIKTAFFHVLYR